MAETASIVEPVLDEPQPRRLSRSLYRYFFYGWLFQDTDEGSEMERLRAERSNRARARWLPVYMRRWLVLGLVVCMLERWSEAAVPQSLLPGMLAVVMTFVVMNLMITGICWAFLRDRRRWR